MYNGVYCRMIYKKKPYYISTIIYHNKLYYTLRGFPCAVLSGGGLADRVRGSSCRSETRSDVKYHVCSNSYVTLYIIILTVLTTISRLCYTILH